MRPRSNTIRMKPRSSSSASTCANSTDVTRPPTTVPPPPSVRCGPVVDAAVPGHRSGGLTPTGQRIQRRGDPGEVLLGGGQALPGLLDDVRRRAGEERLVGQLRPGLGGLLL